MSRNNEYLKERVHLGIVYQEAIYPGQVMIEVGKIVHYIEYSIAHTTVSIAKCLLSKSTYVDTYTRNIKQSLSFVQAFHISISINLE